MFLINYLQNKGGLHMAQNEAPIILDETEQKIIDIIDAHRDQIIDFAKDILHSRGAWLQRIPNC